jgi:hypothetical protein
MDKVEIFNNAEAYDKSVEFLNDTPEMQRFNFHRGKVYPFQSAQRKETDTHVYWAYTEAKPRFENNRLFYSRNNKYGFTYDKSNKDFKFWFGRTIHEIPPFMLSDVFKHFNIDWYGALGPSLSSLVNATMVKNMIKGKITNPRDYVKAYLKTSPYRKSGISPELFYKTFSTGINSPKSYRKIIEYSTDANHALEFIAKHGNGYMNHSITDLYDQAAVLDRRVNPKWSEARMKEVHAEWTREIMSVEIKSIKQYEYEYPEIALPEGLEIISNNYELFEEGTAMKHCVYTNYESNIRSKKYFAFRYEKDGIRATLGVDNYNSDNAKFSQMYGIGNSSVPIDIIDDMKEFIKTDYFQKWCSKQSKSIPSREREPEMDAAFWL